MKLLTKEFKYLNKKSLINYNNYYLFVRTKDLSLQERKKYSKLYLRKGCILEALQNSIESSSKYFEKVLTLDPSDKEAILQLSAKSPNSALIYSN